MTRRWALVVLAATAAVVVLGACGDDDAPPAHAQTGSTATTGAAPLGAGGGRLTGGDAVLQLEESPVEVPGGAGCEALLEGIDASPRCATFVVEEVEVAWAVAQREGGPPVAGLFRRESATEWTRILVADGAGERGFEEVNVRPADLDRDGVPDFVFAFHDGDDLAVDVVNVEGTVVAHLDLSGGHVRVEDGGDSITSWSPVGDRWREEVAHVDAGSIVVDATSTVPSPDGNM